MIASRQRRMKLNKSTNDKNNIDKLLLVFLFLCKADIIQKTRREIEMQLCEILGRVLNIKEVSFHDSFFHRGGHSLNAMQGIGAIADFFHLKLDIRDIFVNSTVDKLDIYLRSHLATQKFNERKIGYLEKTCVQQVDFVEGQL